jgi:dolichol-phosphate mannosyltransferase
MPYARAPRLAGTTKYPLAKMLRFAFDGITGFSVMPLRLAFWLGLCAGLGGLVVICYVMASWISGRAVEGWTSLMVVTLVLGSGQLLVVGLLGEYLGRLYMESKGRPLFVIENIVSQGHAPAAPTVNAAAARSLGKVTTDA